MNLLFIFSVFIFFKILSGLILSNIHLILGIDRAKNQNKSDKYEPRISIIIPAYNEEKCIFDSVKSVEMNSYSNKEIIVVNDGSSDNTLTLLRSLEKKYDNIIVVDQENSGKANAINNGAKNYASGQLIMVLDADSYIAHDAIGKMVQHFSDRSVIAMSANVVIHHYDNLIEYTQYIEYMLSNRFKGAEELSGVEYIIGGVASTFRKSAMEKVGYYDTDTITEDIDFTMKLIEECGNKRFKIGFASDVIAYTEPVKNFKDLLIQRYRWRFGRFSSLKKHHKLFFNFDSKYTKMLTFVKIPKSILDEMYIFINPFLSIFMLILLWKHISFYEIISIFVLFLVYIYSIIVSNEFISIKRKIMFFFGTPILYLFLQLVNIVEFISLLKCLKSIRRIMINNRDNGNWEHVER